MSHIVTSWESATFSDDNATKTASNIIELGHKGWELKAIAVTSAEVSGYGDNHDITTYHNFIYTLQKPLTWIGSDIETTAAPKTRAKSPKKEK